MSFAMEAIRVLLTALCAAGGLAVLEMGAAAELPLIPREVLFGNPEKAAPTISPDGTRLAYLAPEKGVLNVWVRTLGAKDDKVVTKDKKRGVQQFFWQGDGKHILYLQDNDGDENFHIYQTGVESGITRDLTPFSNARAIPVDVDLNFPDQILAGLNLRDARLHDVYRINLQTGGIEMDTENPGDVVGWSADNAMQVRAAQVMKPDGGTEIRVREKTGADWKHFTQWSAEESLGGVAGFSPDNTKLWVLSSVDANAIRLTEIDLATGKAVVVAEDKQFDVSGLMTHPHDHHLEAVQVTRARRDWTVLDKGVGADLDILRKVRDGDVSVTSRDQNDKKWVVSYLMDNGPVYYYLYDRETKKAELLFSSRPNLEKYSLAKMEPVSFPARDGLNLQGYLTLPTGGEKKNLPLILLVHGGPWARDNWGYSSFVQWLANRGYAVLQINYRGSTGYGKAHLNAGDREWAGKMHTDLLDGKKWAIEKGFADPKRVAIMGGSYGGYATLVGLTFTPDEFVCGVDIVGPSSLETLLKSIPPYWLPMKAQFDKRVGNLEKEPAFLRERSPLFKADQIKVPLLIAQGANDPRVKQAESDQIVAAMRKNGKPVEYLVFPDEGHGFARPENNLKFAAATEYFLTKHLGGRSEPPTDKDRWDEVKK